MKLLIVAADRMEFSGVPSLGTITPTPAVRWARSAKLGNHDALLIANGVGIRCAAAAVDAAVPTFSPDAVISIGFCGALDPKLDIGDIVVANQVCSATAAYPAERLPSTHSGAIRTIDHIAQTSAEKRQLFATGACAVEMEAAAVATRASSLRLPFYCIKTVTDLAGEDMANDFNSALRKDGQFDTIFLLRRALRRPFVCLPELMGFRRRSILAARTLGEFLADCRF